jgi:hypothetical protein
MNNYQHGMRSSQILLPWESEEELQQRRQRIIEALQPRDDVERMLAERVVKRDWYAPRGQRAANSRAADVINELVVGADDREAREVERLAPLMEEGDRDAFRQLRSFPAGVAHLLEQ